MKIIAHRGASGEFPENSLLAFEQAIVQGCDGIEFDVQYHHASGEFILLHEQYLQHNGQRTHFNQLALTELLNVTPTKNRNICTLADALPTISKQCLINIELKSAAQGVHLGQEITKLKQLIQQAINENIITEEQLILSSFNHHALLLCSTMLPNINTAALIACCPVDYAKFCQALKVGQLNLAIDFLTQEIVTDAHNRGLEVWVYTVDSIEEIQQCLSYGVNGIFTNFPQHSRKLLLSLQ
jgi:glycerophosphoryl diester phosphodiesterase